MYVDDFFIFVKGVKFFHWVKDILSSRFSMIDLREVAFILGLQVTRDKNWKNIMMGLFGYVIEHTKFGMATCKPLATPLNASVKLLKGQNRGSMEEECEMKNIINNVVICNLMYYIFGTSPNLVVVVGVVKFFNNPGLPHW
jgi:hypothetical protein